jgi:hypothetical protein
MTLIFQSTGEGTWNPWSRRHSRQARAFAWKIAGIDWRFSAPPSYGNAPGRKKMDEWLSRPPRVGSFGNRLAMRASRSSRYSDRASQPARRCFTSSLLRIPAGPSHMSLEWRRFPAASDADLWARHDVAVSDWVGRHGTNYLVAHGHAGAPGIWMLDRVWAGLTLLL